MRSQQGFSLAEVLLAMFVLALVTLSTLALTGTSLRAVSKSTERVNAKALAREHSLLVVHQVKNDRPSGNKEEFWEHDSSSQEWVREEVKVGTTPFLIRTYAITVRDTTGAVLGEEGKRLKKINTVVSWSEEGELGQGKTSVLHTVLLRELE